MSALPVGRRVAQWRVRRNLTQQQFADRLGKSKSWVDKVERGARRLERLSSLREVADALRIDVATLLPERAGPPAPAAGVERIRVALARYHVEPPNRPPDLARVRAGLDHAEQTYRHARYPALRDLLPGLLDTVRRAQAARPGRAADELLVSAYGLVALALVKVGQGESAWLAADRGIAVALAAADARLAAAATVPLSQALRAVGRRRSAMEAAMLAAQRLGPPRRDASADPPPRSGLSADVPSRCGLAADAPLRGTLLLQAALAAGGLGDRDSALAFLDQADAVDHDVPGGAHELPGGAGFGPASVEAARVVVEAALGDVALATARHEQLVAGDRWRWLPVEHRAAHLLDVARACATAGDMSRAGRALLDAERTAHAEIHDRPVARGVVGVVARAATAPADLHRLAATLHVT
ncbi:Transcriptional regulator, contains XRE-family HTH domain [Micromonospora nigra]|uniref:Transcriptional regulator, contains XRE-family HTH domain n=1 Tax=Micromonospora nigra TaxID=145857 RepID=A0A1C6ST99_9ACTN|nr:helix-turn-helix domain-containing protein [Micromonospora nigra]SCL32697.1 Transcriptional regulator, contains XRE-family HTH domain [Micromonospora nigra]